MCEDAWAGSGTNYEERMALAFTHDVRAPRVVFGSGAVQRIGDEMDRLGAARVLLVCTARRGDAVERVLAAAGARVAGVFDGARMHVPADVADAALAEARRVDADLCLAVGGGSAIGTAKAVALRGGPGFLAVPTTYAGSEMTAIWGMTEGGRKTTGRDPRVLARTVVYDPDLTASLPRSVAGPSGMNALAHCVEALYAPEISPATASMAEEGIRALAASLPAVARGGAGEEAREGALYGAWLAGSALGAAQMGLHHRICHALGGSFGLPHAETHAVVLPHAAAFNAPAAPAARARAARALGADDAAGALFDLGAALGCPSSLREIGLREDQLDEAAMRVVETPYPNPRPFDRASVRALLDDAWHGRRPSSAASIERID
jgi:maleylacetate reductase